MIRHPADELVEDIEPVDPEGKYGPAKRRPVAEGIVRRAPLLRCQADPLGSGHRRRAGHAPRARRLARLRSLGFGEKRGASGIGSGSCASGGCSVMNAPQQSPDGVSARSLA